MLWLMNRRLAYDYENQDHSKHCILWIECRVKYFIAKKLAIKGVARCPRILLLMLWCILKTWMHPRSIYSLRQAAKHFPTKYWSYPILDQYWHSWLWIKLTLILPNIGLTWYVCWISLSGLLITYTLPVLGSILKYRVSDVLAR